MLASSERQPASPHARMGPRSSARSFMLFLSIVPAVIVLAIILLQELLEAVRDALAAHVVEIGLQHLAELVQCFSAQSSPCPATLQVAASLKPGSHVRPYPCRLVSDRPHRPVIDP